MTTNHAAIEFPGRERSETVQFYFRQHWVRLIRPLTRMIIWLALLSIGFWLSLAIDVPEQETTRRVTLLLLCLFLLYSQLEFIAEFYRHFLYVLVVTDKKIHRIKKTLFFVDDHQSVNVTALQDVFKSQHGPIQNILRFGTLTLEAQESVLRIHFVPDIQRKYNAILHLRGWEAARASGPPTHDHPPIRTIDD